MYVKVDGLEKYAISPCEVTKLFDAWITYYFEYITIRYSTNSLHTINKILWLLKCDKNYAMLKINIKPSIVWCLLNSKIWFKKLQNKLRIIYYSYYVQIIDTSVCT